LLLPEGQTDEAWNLPKSNVVSETVEEWTEKNFSVPFFFLFRLQRVDVKFFFEVRSCNFEYKEQRNYLQRAATICRKILGKYKLVYITGKRRLQPDCWLAV
jgi:hypothetical protein